ncbi:winged helix-turn-helix transcriptional regulator [Candidatus Gracilibacteria bacterium]|nr:winged helix-turn-helix transcriptional regulator [Thermales bacterium]NJL96742.1 winged helix-turn-helix transcriptional regulator [Candidatus Gracilibacteria bacterium]NJS41591.1 winged helix-turn-helix transcriptional regulator [Candidatus Gracilibacteria bacterium]
MVELSTQLDLVFGSLSNSTRRNILSRLLEKSLTIGEIADHYKMSFAAVAKHIGVLEKARLINKRSIGNEKLVSADSKTLKKAYQYLGTYEQMWQERYDNLENLLNN